MREKINWISLFAVPMCIFYFSQALLAPVFGNITWQLQITNVVLFEAIAFILIAITGRPRLSLWIQGVVFWLFALANAFVYQFRGSYIMVWDFISIPTAVNVASNYSYKMNSRSIFWSIMFLLLFVGIWFIRPNIKAVLNRVWKRLVLGLVGILLIVGISNMIHIEAIKEAFDIHDSKFSIEHVTEMNGMMIGFIYKMKYMSVYEPEGYIAAEVRKTLDETEVEGEVPEELPNIIVVMNEAFSDLGQDYPFETNEDYMPFIHSLQDDAENVVSGYMNASVLGGKTPNTEFEFLTGNTLAFLPEDSIPYQQFVKKKIDALPHYFASLGYRTIATHPYNSSGWDRTMAYPLLGFQEYYFKEAFDLSPENLVRDYIKDDAYYKQLEQNILQKEGSDGPVFSFNVTMQNHSGYTGTYPNFKQTIFLKDTEGRDAEDVEKLQNYLSLIRLSDDAFKNMVEYYEKSDKPTILVFFGDHQPPQGLLNAVRPEDKEDHEGEGIKVRRVPFIIWANYDIEEKSGIETSANYLGNLVLKTAGIPLTRYRTQLDAFSKRFPVVSAVRSVDDKGTTRQMEETDPIYGDYSRLQYYELFDDEDEYE